MDATGRDKDERVKVGQKDYWALESMVLEVVAELGETEPQQDS